MLFGKQSNKNTMSSVKSRRFFNTTERWVVTESSSFSFFENTKTALVLSAATTATCEQGISILCSHRINRFRRHYSHAVNRHFTSVLLNTKHLHRPFHYIIPLVQVYPNFWVKAFLFCFPSFYFSLFLFCSPGNPTSFLGKYKTGNWCLSTFYCFP